MYRIQNGKYEAPVPGTTESVLIPYRPYLVVRLAIILVYQVPVPGTR